MQAETLNTASSPAATKPDDNSTRSPYMPSRGIVNSAASITKAARETLSVPHVGMPAKR